MNKQEPLSYLSQFLEEYPLYTKFGTDQPLIPEDFNHLRFHFFCKNENKTTPFLLEPALLNSHINHNGNGLSIHHGTEFTEIYHGVCQSCGNYKINIVISSGIQEEKPRYFIKKIGQDPAPEVIEMKLPGYLHYFLNDRDRGFYINALKDLDAGRGIGAITYLRRVIENEISRIIESLEEFHPSHSDSINKALASYQADHTRSRFIDDTKPFFSGELKEHGASIVLMLHDFSSININELDEEECLKKSKDVDMMFRYLTRKIVEMKNHTPHFVRDDK